VARFELLAGRITAPLSGASTVLSSFPLKLIWSRIRSHDSPKQIAWDFRLTFHGFPIPSLSRGLSISNVIFCCAHELCQNSSTHLKTHVSTPSPDCDTMLLNGFFLNHFRRHRRTRIVLRRERNTEHLEQVMSCKAARAETSSECQQHEISAVVKE
jgi:hypothetical protein